jgi:hypothetical protein
VRAANLQPKAYEKKQENQYLLIGVLSSSRFYSSAPFFSFFERSSLNWHHILVDSNNLQGYPKARKNQREIREKPSGKKKAASSRWFP